MPSEEQKEGATTTGEQETQGEAIPAPQQEDASQEPAGSTVTGTESPAELSLAAESPSDSGATDVADGFDEATLARAAEWGIGEEQARALGSKDVLEWQLAQMPLLIGQHVQYQAELQQKQAGGNGASPEPPKPVPAPVAQEQEPPKPAPTPPVPIGPAGLELKKVDLSDDYDPEMISLNENVNAMHQHHSRQLGELTARNEQITELVQTLFQGLTQLIQARDTEEFDGFVGGLGEEWTDVFGTGTHADTAPDSPQFQNRDKLWRNMGVLRSGFAAMGKTPPSGRALLQQTLRATFGDKADTVARRKVVSRMRSAQGALTTPPTNRETKSDLTPEARAIQNIEAKLAEIRERGE